MTKGKEKLDCVKVKIQMASVSNPCKDFLFHRPHISIFTVCLVHHHSTILTPLLAIVNISYLASLLQTSSRSVRVPSPDLEVTVLEKTLIGQMGS